MFTVFADFVDCAIVGCNINYVVAVVVGPLCWGTLESQLRQWTYLSSLEHNVQHWSGLWGIYQLSALLLDMFQEFLKDVHNDNLY